jgi:hypothetical protein
VGRAEHYDDRSRLKLAAEFTEAGETVAVVHRCARCQQRRFELLRFSRCLVGTK